MRKETLRMDIVSRGRFPKEELFRLVLVGGVFTLDPEQRAPGRGVYVKRSLEALSTLKVKKVLEKTHHAPLKEGELERMVSLCQTKKPFAS